jgi:ribonuclease HI
METVYIFSDGGYQSRNRVGAYAVIFYNENNPELFSKYDRVQGLDYPKDSNFAEMLGLKYALNVVKHSKVFEGKEIVICLDSLNCINLFKHYTKWIKNGWKTKNKKPVKHKETIIQLNKLFDEIINQGTKDIVFEHIKSHTTPPTDKTSEEYLFWYLNDEVDFLCFEEMSLKNKENRIKKIE